MILKHVHGTAIRIRRLQPPPSPPCHTIINLPILHLYTQHTSRYTSHYYILLAHETIKQFRPPTSISKLFLWKVVERRMNIFMDDKQGVEGCVMISV